jgi:hypothetical protein
MQARTRGYTSLESRVFTGIANRTPSQLRRIQRFGSHGPSAMLAHRKRAISAPDVNVAAVPVRAAAVRAAADVTLSLCVIAARAAPLRFPNEKAGPGRPKRSAARRAKAAVPTATERERNPTRGSRTLDRERTRTQNEASQTRRGMRAAMGADTGVSPAPTKPVKAPGVWAKATNERAATNERRSRGDA